MTQQPPQNCDPAKPLNDLVCELILLRSVLDQNDRFGLISTRYSRGQIIDERPLNL